MTLVAMRRRDRRGNEFSPPSRDVRDPFRRSGARDRRGSGGRRRWGFPPAAQIVARPDSPASISVVIALRRPTGGTPPIAKPLASRTKSGSARAIGSPTSPATLRSSTRTAPDAIDKDSAPARLAAKDQRLGDLGDRAADRPRRVLGGLGGRVELDDENSSPSAAWTLRALAAVAGFIVIAPIFCVSSCQTPAATRKPLAADLTFAALWRGWARVQENRLRPWSPRRCAVSP